MKKFNAFHLCLIYSFSLPLNLGRQFSNRQLLPYCIQKLSIKPRFYKHYLQVGDEKDNYTIGSTLNILNISSVQFSSVAQSCLTLCDPMDCSTLGLPVHHQLLESTLKLMSIESVMPSNHLKLYCRPPPAFNLSRHQGLFT